MKPAHRRIATHLALLLLTAVLIALCMVYPFLSGGYDRLAVPLSTMTQVFGVAGLRRAVERGFENAERAERLLRQAGVWRIVTPARMGVVTFIWSPADVPAAEAREATGGLVEAALQDGTALISSTTLRGEPVLRICAINPRTTTADLERSVARLAELARKASRA